MLSSGAAVVPESTEWVAGTACCEQALHASDIASAAKRQLFIQYSQGS
jgi:hypothetical protein